MGEGTVSVANSVAGVWGAMGHWMSLGFAIMTGDGQCTWQWARVLDTGQF